MTQPRLHPQPGDRAGFTGSQINQPQKARSQGSKVGQGYLLRMMLIILKSRDVALSGD